MAGYCLIHGNVFEDQKEALSRDSARRGNAGAGEIDYSLLLDGLSAEREQGITIDVAYRYFTTSKRKFIIADTPGHEQYTRNMATGGSTAELAIILIDARYGVLPQTKRHSFITSILGIKRVVLAINKMDLVDFSQERFDEIVREYNENVASKLAPRETTAIPLSALRGDNVVSASDATPWYEGPTLLEHLESVPVSSDRQLDTLFYPVQYVLRPNLDFRGFCGTVASGVIRQGQDVLVLPAGKKSTVKGIFLANEAVDEAYPPLAATVTLNDEIDCSRGDVIVHPDQLPAVGNAFEAMLVWMTENPLQVGKSYLFKVGAAQVTGVVAQIEHVVEVNTLEQTAGGEALPLNGIARVRIELNRTIVFDRYDACRAAGSFIIIDRVSNGTVGAGMIQKSLGNESKAVQRLMAGEVGDGAVTGPDRAARFAQVPATVWLRGPKAQLLAERLEQELFIEGFLPYVLDLTNMNLPLANVIAFAGETGDPSLRRAVSLSRLCRDIGVVTLAVLAEPG